MKTAVVILWSMLFAACALSGLDLWKRNRVVDEEITGAAMLRRFERFAPTSVRARVGFQGPVVIVLRNRDAGFRLVLADSATPPRRFIIASWSTPAPGLRRT